MAAPKKRLVKQAETKRLSCKKAKVSIAFCLLSRTNALIEAIYYPCNRPLSDPEFLGLDEEELDELFDVDELDACKQTDGEREAVKAIREGEHKKNYRPRLFVDGAVVAKRFEQFDSDPIVFACEICGGDVVRERCMKCERVWRGCV